jgi:hypothetical protein
MAPQRVTAENSWILRWTCLREVYLKGSSRTATLHFTFTSLYTHCRNFSRLLIEVNRVIVSSFLPGLTLRSTSTSALALSVWKRSSHADEFHELASHVLYCTPLNFINCETERCLLHTCFFTEECAQLKLISQWLVGYFWGWKGGEGCVYVGEGR